MKREQNPKDGREQLLMLTDLGKRVNQEHHQYEAYFLEEFMNLFCKEDYDALADILERSSVCNISK